MPQKPRRLKTPVQLWIADTRKGRGESSADLARLTGVTEATARAWESRGRPSEDALAILERHWDSTAPTSAGGDATLPPADLRLYGLLEAQTEAFNRLAAAIERMVDQPLVVPPEIATAMRRAVAELEPPAPDTSSRHPQLDPPPAEETRRTENHGTGTTAPGRNGNSHP